MEQLQSRRSHNEAADSSRDFVMGSHSWQTAQTDAVHLPARSRGVTVPGLTRFSSIMHQHAATA